MPKDWTIYSPQIKQDSVIIFFDSNNADDLKLSVSARDRHMMISGSDYEQAVKRDNVNLLAQTPGVALIHPTECTKYIIDGKMACSMTYTTRITEYTEEQMDIDFQSSKQEVLIIITGSADIFDK